IFSFITRAPDRNITRVSYCERLLPESATSKKMSSSSKRELDCNGNACSMCGYCRDWKHSGHNWYRVPDATCNDYRYWHYLIYRHSPAFQRGIGDRLISHYFHRGPGGHVAIFDSPTHAGYHNLCECKK
ncbi:unnamed protein product, partial [Rotaria sordida]